MEVKSHQADAFLKAIPDTVRAIMTYGPDEGMVRERADNAQNFVLAGEKDPFRLSELTGSQLSEDPARLNDEASALSLMGGRRVVRIRNVTDRHAALFTSFLKESEGDTLIVVEGGDLNNRSKLVKAFKDAGNAAVIPCYRDEARDLSRVISDSLRTAGLTASPDALAYLNANLGGDRQITRSELRKLALFMEGQEGKTVQLEHVTSCVGDSAALTLSDIAMAVADGNTVAADRGLRSAFSEGILAVGILRAVSGHFQRLHLVVSSRESGSNLDSAMGKLRPQVFWKHKAAFKAQASGWNSERVGRALKALMDAEVKCKQTGSRDAAVASEVLLRISRASPARRR